MLESYISDLTDRLKDREYAGKYGTEIAKLDFAMTLSRARNQAKLTQTQMAEKLGVSQAYVAKLESGEANPTIAAIGKMLAILGLRLVTNVESLTPEENTPAVTALDPDPICSSPAPGLGR
jgi:ribosome-binding protein aMBF1 (putative translation factor)